MGLTGSVLAIDAGNSKTDVAVVTTDGDVLATAREVAATAPVASRLTKIALADGGHADFETALQWEALAQPITLATEDLQEGILAAREKRSPVFRGR